MIRRWQRSSGPMTLSGGMEEADGGAYVLHADLPKWQTGDPPTDGDYLTYDPTYKDMTVRRWDGHWFSTDDFDDPGNITHWMPLPEPPEQKEN